jgi:hypothetical protein
MGARLKTSLGTVQGSTFRQQLSLLTMVQRSARITAMILESH